MAVEVGDREPQAVHFDRVADLGAAAELVEDQPADAVGALVRQVGAGDAVEVGQRRAAFHEVAAVRLDGLLRQMRRARQHLAIVLGEYGTPVGIVSMEDIVEEIVGEIEDELDDGRTRVTRQSDGSFTADGRVSLTDFNRVAGTELPSEHAHSVGGLIFDELGRAPEKGDVVQVDGAHLEVLEVDGHRIDRVRVRL